MIGLLVCGPPGTGKTTHLHTMLRNAGAEPSEYTIIDPDTLGLSPADASAKAIELVHSAIDAKQKFVYSASCRKLDVVKEMLKHMKQKKYRTVVAIVYASLPKTIERIASRHEQHVPEEAIRYLYSYFKTRAEAYMNLPQLDEVYLYNNETQFNLLLHKKKKKIVCSTPDNEFFFDISNYCSPP
jgi:predicted ABC-type ATPase